MCVCVCACVCAAGEELRLHSRLQPNLVRTERHLFLGVRRLGGSVAERAVFVLLFL